MFDEFGRLIHGRLREVLWRANELQNFEIFDDLKSSVSKRDSLSTTDLVHKHSFMNPPKTRLFSKGT